VVEKEKFRSKIKSQNEMGEAGICHFYIIYKSAALDNIKIEAFACIFELSRPDLL
jgi:hypothetical protein